MTYAIRITWRDGHEEYLRDLRRDRLAEAAVTAFETREAARRKQRALLALGGSDVSSLDIVPYPRQQARLFDGEC